MNEIINTINTNRGLLIALLVLIVIDFLTGTVRAIYEKKLNSRTGYKGILKKVALLAIVCLAIVIDTYTLNSGLIANTVIIFYIANEGISLLENTVAMGVPIPNQIKEILETLHKKAGDNDENK